MIDSEKRIDNINRCSACGKRHKRIWFAKYYQALTDRVAVRWFWVGQCPETDKHIRITGEVIEGLNESSNRN